jgi:hypothetical protein
MEAVHRLNDLPRNTFGGGEIGITPGIQALSGTLRASIMQHPISAQPAASSWLMPGSSSGW